MNASDSSNKINFTDVEHSFTKQMNREGETFPFIE